MGNSAVKLNNVTYAKVYNDMQSNEVTIHGTLEQSGTLKLHLQAEILLSIN